MGNGRPISSKDHLIHISSKVKFFSGEQITQGDYSVMHSTGRITSKY